MDHLSQLERRGASLFRRCEGVMIAMQRVRQSIYLVICLALAVHCSVLFAKGDEIPCTHVYKPARPGYDFTADVGHWGQKKIRYDFKGGEKVGHIYINRLPIFNTANPAEDNFLYRWADRVHLKTRPYVIRDLLLFHKGGPITNRLIRESERILRRQKFASAASIRAVSECNKVVDLEVITKEVWTLLPELSFGTAGGASESSIGIADSNFLGTGSRFIISYGHNQNRTSTLFHYQNDDFRGTHVRLLTHLEHNSDGYVRQFQVDLPFYQLNSKRAWGVASKDYRETDKQYYRGNTISEIDTRDNHFETWFGHSNGLENGVTNRFLYGIAYDRARYAALPGIPTTSPMPENRTLAYPYFEFQQVQDKYAVAYNINQINRQEDIHTGRSLQTLVGFSTVDAPRLVFGGGVADTFASRHKELFQGHLSWYGRWNFDTHSSEDVHLGLTLDYHHGQTAMRSLHFMFKFMDTWNRSPENQVILGGATGLRGYPINYASGDMSYLFTAEQQFFTNYSVLSLYNVGFVAFFDTGRAFYKHNNGPDDGELSDVGVGLRFVPTKTDKENVVHVDLGMPLKRLPGAHGMQIMVEVEKTI